MTAGGEQLYTEIHQASIAFSGYKTASAIKGSQASPGGRHAGEFVLMGYPVLDLPPLPNAQG